MSNIRNFSDRVITYSFYLLFALVPLIFTPFNYELFEFNKMWFVYIVTIVIMASWLLKMVSRGEIKIQRTPLDIPILLFLTSQIISTILSIDLHTSIWGYYSRFNGGLLSIISYIALYYAFVSNLGTKEQVIKVLKISLTSGALVAFYGILEHFGIDSDRWVQDVQNRVFSTLGQPNWLAAYLSILIPIAIALGMENPKIQTLNPKQIQNFINLYSIPYALYAILFYLTILFTKSRSGFAGLWIGLIFFLGYLWLTKNKQLLNLKSYIVILLLFGGITFLVGSPFEQLKSFTFDGLRTRLLPTTNQLPTTTKPQGPALESGGTESGEIRKIVWQGAIDIAKHYPFFGSGVETFAYSYYQYRPAAHNQTSEWDFLYNKAHNEYLNYLATTGLFGLGSYLLMIGLFLWTVLKNLKSKSLEIALLSAYLSILVSNFFGFSVVTVNLYFFLIPAFVLLLTGLVNPNKVLLLPITNSQLPIFNFKFAARWLGILTIIIITYYLLLNLVLFWLADVDFARGYNLDRSGQYEKAYSSLFEAVRKRTDEPTFKDELSVNAAALSTIFYTQDESTASAELVNQALALSGQVVRDHPNIVTFWKTRARLFYILSGMDNIYLTKTIEVLEQAQKLAPTDVRITYNLALLYDQTGNQEKAINLLTQIVKLKSNYRDAYYALGLFYDEQKERQKAIEQMDYIIKNIATGDAQATEKLLEWRGY